MRRPSSVSDAGSLTGSGQLDRGRVVRVAPGDDRVEERDVAHGLADRADLVEAGGEGDDPEARDGAVRRPQADVAAERGRLLDRAAGVGAEAPRGQAARHGRRRAASRAARHTRRGPTGCGKARRPSSPSRSPWRTRRCSSCRSPTGLPPGSGRRRSSRTRACSRRGSSIRPSSRRPSSRSRP